DSDNDSLGDVVEGASHCPDKESVRGNGMCDGDDADGDGIVSYLETMASGSSFGTLGQKAPLDTDSDGSPDERDLDSDGDTISDIQESKNSVLDARLMDGIVDDGDESDDQDGILEVAVDSD